MCDYLLKIPDNAINDEAKRYSTWKPLQRPKIYNRHLFVLDNNSWVQPIDGLLTVSFVHFFNLSNKIKLFFNRIYRETGTLY
jgi:hypothetical protein